MNEDTITLDECGPWRFVGYLAKDGKRLIDGESNMQEIEPGDLEFNESKVQPKKEDV